jgi:metallothiol transferase
LVRTQGLTHIHLVVRDLDRSLHFYQSVFGMEELFREGTDLVFLRTPGCQDTITLNAGKGKAKTGAKGGVAHFGFRLQDKADLDRAVAEVEAAGGKLLRTGEHAPGHRFAYVEDPDGFVIEF